MTLAQSYLNLHPPHDDDGSEMGKMVQWTHEFIVSRLLAPLPNDFSAAEQTAERFVFEANPIHIVSDLIAAGAITRKTMFEVVKLPHINFWMEMPIAFEGGTKGQLGFMVGKAPKGATAIEGYMDVLAVVMAPEGTAHAVPFSLIQLPEFPIPEKGGFRPFYYGTRFGPEIKDDDLRECEQFVQELVDCLFLLTVPKVVEYRDAQFGPRKEKVRERTGKPLVEFKRVDVVIGGIQARYKSSGPHASTGATEGEGRYRAHRVGPFFRTYRKRRDQPKVVLLDQFWRGNPKLGIIIKEKHYHDRAKSRNPPEAKS